MSGESAVRPGVGGLQPFFVHESSYVDEPCTIGPGTKIWHFCHVMPGARIGKGCNIGQNVLIGANVVVGDNVKIQNNVSVYAGVTLEDDVFCGPSMVFTNVATPRSHVRRNDPDRDYAPTLVKRGATLGANCTVVCGNTIGEYAFVGAGAVVTRDVPPHAIVYGNPARIRGWACSCGVRLCAAAPAGGDAQPGGGDAQPGGGDVQPGPENGVAGLGDGEPMVCPDCGRRYLLRDLRLEVVDVRT